MQLRSAGNTMKDALLVPGMLALLARLVAVKWLSSLWRVLFPGCGKGGAPVDDDLSCEDAWEECQL